MNGLAYHIGRPAVLWALHFTAIYALISAACAPRSLLAVQSAQLVALAVTAVAAALALFWLMASLRRLRAMSRQAPERALAQAAVWTAAISLLAIGIDLWPMATLSGCTG